MPTVNRTHEPFTFRMRQLLEYWALDNDIIIGQVMRIMLVAARHEILDRLKYSSGKLYNNIGVEVDQSGKSTATFRYVMPPTFDAVNRGRRPGEMSEKSSTDVAEIKQWIKNKRKMFSGNFDQFRFRELELRNRIVKNSSIRQSMHHFTLGKKNQTKRMTDEEVARMVTKKIRIGGTRNSRYKFIGIARHRRKKSDGKFIEYNKPIYVKYNKLLSTSIQESAFASINRYLARTDLAKGEVPTVAKQKSEKFFKNFAARYNADIDDIRRVVDDLEKELKKLFIHIWKRGGGRMQRRQPVYNKDEFGEKVFTGYKMVPSRWKPPKTEKGYYQGGRTIRIRAINIMLGGKDAAAPKDYKTVFDIFKEHGLINAIPKEIESNARKAIIEMLKQKKVNELRALRKLSKKSQQESRFNQTDEKTWIEMMGEFDLTTSFGRDAIKKTMELGKKLESAPKIDNAYKLEEWAKYIDKILKLLK